MKNYGTLDVDIAFGGDSFVVVDAAALGFSLAPDEARDMARAGLAIVKDADAHIGFRHPTLQGMNSITFCLFAGPVETENDRRASRHAVAIRPGKIDRSPTGAASSAHPALMRARGEAQIGEEVIFQSPLESVFVARIEQETQFGGRVAITTSVAGRAWITERRQLLLDPDDPWPTGYCL